MTKNQKFVESFNEHFNQLPEENRNKTIQRIKDINDIPQDADISQDLPQLIVQDMLFNVIDDVFRVDHVLTDLVQNGIPHKFVEEHSMSAEQATAFHAGVKLATSIMRDTLVDSEVINTFITAVREVQEN